VQKETKCFPISSKEKGRGKEPLLFVDPHTTTTRKTREAETRGERDNDDDMTTDTTSKFSSSNNAVRRISQEMKEFIDSEAHMDTDPSAFATWAEPLEDDIFEWHFALYGAEGTRDAAFCTHPLSFSLPLFRFSE
tara:strand:- start:217 stop:621 length:405 start_codon:yes stop_codon:yes gene_type:complete